MNKERDLPKTPTDSKTSLVVLPDWTPGVDTEIGPSGEEVLTEAGAAKLNTFGMDVTTRRADVGYKP